MGTHHLPLPSPCTGDGCTGMGGSAMGWVAGARKEAVERFSRQVQAGFLPSPGGCRSSQVSTHSFCGQESPEHGLTTAEVPRKAPRPIAQPG